MKKIFLKMLLTIITCTLLVATGIPTIVSAKEITAENYNSIAVGDTVTMSGTVFTVTEITNKGTAREPLYVPSFELTTYAGTAKSVTVPSIISIKDAKMGRLGKPINLGYVTSIGDSAFAQSDVEVVDVSKTNITVIGDNAFDSSALRQIVFNENKIIEIGASAFRNTKLTEFYLVSSELNIIGEKAFLGCDNLTAVALIMDGAGHQPTFTGGNTLFPSDNAEFVIYSDSTAVLQYLEQGWNTAFVQYVNPEDSSFILSVSEDEFAYAGVAVNPTVTMTSGSTDVTAKFDKVYKRDGVVTTDFISAGTITVEMTGIWAEGYAGTRTYEITILPVDSPVIIIARDKNVEDGAFETGTSNDVIYWGLVDGDVVESVKLTANGDALIPSDVVIKNGDLDVSASYSDIIYVNGRSFTEKSIESFTKSTEGNVDTYTIVFGDGTTETIVITNGVDGEDGQDGAVGATGPAGPKGEKGDKGDAGASGINGTDGSDGTSTLLYVAMGIGGISLAGTFLLFIIVLKKKKI